MGFSIRQALRECETLESRLDLADSIETIRGIFFTGSKLIERILRYTSFAWSHLGYGSRWEHGLQEVITASRADTKRYAGPTKLSFGEFEKVFSRLPSSFRDNENAFERARFADIARILKRAKVHEKLDALVALRNSVEHDKEDTVSLSAPQLRARCRAVLNDARNVLAKIDGQRALPVTVSPEEERRDRYGRRVLRLLDPDGVAIEVHVRSETDLTEPLIYFPSGGQRGRDVDPRFLSATAVEELLGFTNAELAHAASVAGPRS